MEELRLLRSGAEASLFETKYFGRKALLKKRLPKSYRHKELDEKIRLDRTRQEAWLLHRAKEAGIRTPCIYRIDRKNSEILLEFVEGKRAKEALNKKNQKKLCGTIGKAIARMHNAGIIHGDLTTSNIIVKGKTLVFVDFGLGFFSRKIEDMAVDLLSFKKTFEATHCRLTKGWKALLKRYCSESNLGDSAAKQITEVEARARYC